MVSLFILSTAYVAVMIMFLLNLRLKSLVVLLFCSIVGAVPPPPPPAPPENTPTLKYAPSLNDDGVKHAWRGWDPVDLDPSKLESYAKKQHDKMHEQPLATAPELHPQSHATLNENSLRLGTIAGSYAEIQARDTSHTKLPDKPISPGTCIAICGRRILCQAPELLKTCSQWCKKFLQGEGINCQEPTKRATGKPRGANRSTPQRIRKTQGADGTSTAAASSSRKEITWAARLRYWRNSESLRDGQKMGKISNIYKADANAGSPEQDPKVPQPKRGQKRKGAIKSEISKKSKGDSGSQAAVLLSLKTDGRARRVPIDKPWPGQAPKSSNRRQKHRKFSEIYKTDDVAQILFQDLPQGNRF